MPRAALAAALLASASEAARLLPAGPEVVPGEYFVVLRSDVASVAHGGIAERLGGRSLSVGTGAKGFRAVHARLNATQLESALAHPDVRYVEPNQHCHAAGMISCPHSQGEPQSWGQKRTTAVSPGDVADVYAHDDGWGEGVDAYVLDTGIRITHEEFGGRALWGANFVGGADEDHNGHGTHCAGTIGGRTFGVAKKATLIAVKVLDDSGSAGFDSVIRGIEWTVQESRARGRRGVGSMSLGGARSEAMNDAVGAAAADGVLFSSSAGNFNMDACSFSPGSAADGLCVGSTELANSGGAQIDLRSHFSNYGSCVHVFAPGSEIHSAYSGSDGAYATLSGTSMACPHATAVALVALQKYPTLTPLQLRDWVLKEAMGGLVHNAGAGSPDLMLHLNCEHVPAPQTPAPPPTPRPPTPEPVAHEYYTRGPPCDASKELLLDGICLPICDLDHTCPPYTGASVPQCGLMINALLVCTLKCTTDADCTNGATCGTMFNMCYFP